jgi:hypothetical protein
VVVYGGVNGTMTTLGSGARFNVTSSQWSDASCGLTDCDRANGTFFTDGSVIRLLGGEYNPDYPSQLGNYLTAESGLAYDPETNQWSGWPEPDGTPPSASAGPFADDGRRLYFPSGNDVVLIYDRATGWLPSDVEPMPPGFCYYEAAYAWAGSEVIGWSGQCSAVASDVGARYQPPARP